MPQTSLKIKDKYLVIRTDIEEGKVIVKCYNSDEHFNYDINKPDRVDEDLVHTEEQIHKDLRAMAEENGHLVRQYSTDPQWNPGYIDNTEELTKTEENEKLPD